MTIISGVWEEKASFAFALKRTHPSSLRGVERLMDKHGPDGVLETGAVLIPVSILKGDPWGAFTFG